VGPADGPDDFRQSEQIPDGIINLVAEFLAATGEISSQIVAFEMLPESFDRVEVGTVGRKIDRLEVVPFQALGFVPAVTGRAFIVPRCRIVIIGFRTISHALIVLSCRWHRTAGDGL
jgi:hypothetical protein